MISLACYLVLNSLAFGSWFYYIIMKMNDMEMERPLEEFMQLYGAHVSL